MIQSLPRLDIVPSDVCMHALAWCLDDFDESGFSDRGLTLPDALSGAVQKRRAEFLVGRLCAQEAIQSAGGTVEGCLPINEDRSPRWPHDFVGAITHTDGFAAAVVADSRRWKGVGIDTERLVASESAGKLASSVLTDPEQAFFDQPPCELSPGEFFTLIFSAKESIYKCLRPRMGHFFGFEEASLDDMCLNAGGGIDARFSLGPAVADEAGAPSVIVVQCLIRTPFVHTFTQWRAD